MQLIFIENWLGNGTVKALGWTFFHSLWIGLLAAVFTGIVILTTRRSPARLRYNLLAAVLAFFVAACVVTFFVQIGSANTPVASESKTDTELVLTGLPQVEQSIASSNGFVAKFTGYYNANANFFVLAWAIFFLLHSIRLLTGLAGVSRMRHYKTEIPDEEWLNKLKELSVRLGIKQSVLLLESRLAKIPVAIGVFKPVILMPLGLLSKLPPDQVEAILLHELSHIRRKDYLVNIFQRMTEAIFFFNPALLWLSSLIRQEREACCDDMVVNVTGQKIHYLEALVAFQEYTAEPPAYAMAIRSKRHYLLNRVQRLLTRENKKLNMMEKIALIAGLIIFTAFSLIPNHKVNTNENAVSIDPVISRWPLLPAADDAKKTVTGKPESQQDIYHAVQTASQPANDKIIPDQPAVQIADTVPAVYDRFDTIRFKSVSATTTDDGVTKKETIVAVEQEGKKYTIRKLNNKVTQLQVDDKVIPENEIESYAPLLRVLDEKREHSTARKDKEMEEKKARILESRKDAEHIVSKRKEEMIEKRMVEKRKGLETDREGLNEKRKELAAIQSEVSARKREMQHAEEKTKSKLQEEIKHKEKMLDDKLKQIAIDKEKMQLKKDAIGEDKKALEKEKEKNKVKELPKPVTNANTKEIRQFTRYDLAVREEAKRNLLTRKIIVANASADSKIAAAKQSTGEFKVILEKISPAGGKLTKDVLIVERKAVLSKGSKPAQETDKLCPPVN